MRKLFILPFLLLTLFATSVVAQNVNINASGGVPFATYPTLTAAFNAINAGTHTGQILVSVIASTNEGATSAILNNSGAGAASYTKVYIGTTLSNAVISGAPPTGTAVVKLNGADNVTINGAQNGAGISRNLTIENTVAAATANTAALWIQSNGTALGCVGDTVMNCIIRGNDAVNTTATSTFGIYVAGITIGTTGSGADNDNLGIINCDIRRAWVSIFARGTAAGVLNGLLIAGNQLGNATQAESFGRNGIDIQQATSAVISLNDFGPVNSNSTALIFGVELGTGTTTCVATRNTVHDIVNLGAGGCWGLNISGGSGNVLSNNFIYNIRNTAASLTSGTTLAAGIRLNGGTGHQIHFNSVNLFGTTAHTAATQSGALVINSAASVLNIRNNIFANSSVHPIAGSKAASVIVGGVFVWATSTNNYNGYFVPATNTATTTYMVGTQISASDYSTVAAFQTYSLQDANSIPPNNQAAPFASNTNLHITAAPVIVESAGLNIAGITTDFDNQIRQGNGGYSQVPAGTAPDIGADEFASTPADFIVPSISGVTLTPPTGGCTATSHAVQATVTDGSGLTSVVIRWWLNGVAQSDIVMTTSGGGIYTGTIPANGSSTILWQVVATDGSAQLNINSTATQTYQDAFITSEAGPQDTVCSGSSIGLIGSTTWGSPIKITEVTQFSTGTGATAPYPAWVPATGFEDYIEIGNLGPTNVNVGGYTMYVVGITTRQFTFPAGTIIPGGGVAVLHIGAGTDNLANRLFNMGGATNIVQSGSLTGYYLKNSGGAVVDAIATNNYQFNVLATGVTTADWSGTIPSTSARAGAIRTVSDNNTAADWVVSNTPTPLQTLGAMNPGLTTAQPTASWDLVPSGGTITFTPPSSGYHYFTVTNGVCTATDSVWIEVTPLPLAPVVSNDTICGIDTLSLTASGSGTALWYSAPTGGTLLFSGSPYTPVLSATDTFYVELFNGSCSGPRVAVYAEVTPAVPIGGTFSSNPACQDELVTFTASSANTSYVYTWNGLDLSNAVGSSLTANVTYSSPYFIEAIDTAGCRQIATLNLTVNRIGTLDIVSADTIICLGDTANLVADFQEEYLNGAITTTSNGSFIVTDNTPAGVYDTIAVDSVYPGLMLTSDLEVCLDSVVMTWDSDLNIYLYTPCGDQIELTTVNGGSGDNYLHTCFTMSAVTNVNTGTAPFTGSYLPEDVLGFNEVTTCEPNGNWVLYAFDNANGDEATIHQWHITINSVTHYSGNWTATNGFTSASAAISDAPTVTTTYYHTVSDTLTGCELIDSFTVALPGALVASGTGNSPVCSGTNEDVSVVASGGFTGSSYVYDWNGLGSNDSLSVTINSDTTFIITVTDFCGTTATDSVMIFVNPPVSVSATGDTICAGDTATLIANATDGDGNFTYAWSSGGSLMTEMVTPITNTNYTVTVTDGCGSSDVATTSVVLNPLPVASFTFLPAAPQVGQTVTFTNTSTNATSYAWDFGGSGTSNLASPTHVFPTAGSITVTLIAFNDCGSDTTTQTISIATSILDGLAGGLVSVFPNPGNGVFNLSLENLAGNDVVVRVFDLRGEMIVSQNLRVNGAMEHTMIDLTAFSRGMYLLKVETNGHSVTGRLVIQ
jgi:Ig-like domain CHU_C associated/Secretion system C-terminal sorting domain/PKD domain/Lamin Tail Domain/Proprotein convertase P-domain